MRIGLQIVEKRLGVTVGRGIEPRLLIPRDNTVFPAVCANCACHLRLADLDKNLFGPAFRFALQQGEKRAPLHLFGNGQACGLEKRGRQIDDADKLSNCASTVKAGPLQGGRHAN